MYLCGAALTALLMITDNPCVHLKAIESIRGPAALECEDCVKIGAKWVHLRTCQSCGGTRCCDQSPNRHARKHAKVSGHKVIASAQPDERWLYCFEDDAYLDY